MSDKFSRKVLENNDKFIIFYSDWCRFSMDAIELLKKSGKPFKGYKIDNIRGGIDRVLASFNNNKEKLEFDTTHKTRPIIFYKGRFIGGFSELKNYLDSN